MWQYVGIGRRFAINTCSRFRIDRKEGKKTNTGISSSHPCIEVDANTSLKVARSVGRSPSNSGVRSWLYGVRHQVAIAKTLKNRKPEDKIEWMVKE